MRRRMKYRVNLMYGGEVESFQDFENEEQADANCNGLNEGLALGRCDDYCAEVVEIPE
jgi:hypothetical protein